MPFRPLPCPEIVLRAITKAGWLKNDRIVSAAFIWDRNRDPDGLSVNIASRTNVEEWLSGFRASSGADSLHSGRIRTLALDVGQTEEEQDDSHAIITGLPFIDDDPDKAEVLASRLVEMVRKVDRTKRTHRR